MKHLVLFDGVCGLCHRTVQMLLKVDRNRRLTFAPLQGETAHKIFSKYPSIKESLGSLVFVENWGDKTEKIFIRSQGVLRIFRSIGGIWKMVSWLLIVPLVARDAVYNCIARNRYQWFGQFDNCQLPSSDNRERFLP